jgi:hypothetical protein
LLPRILEPYARLRVPRARARKRRAGMVTAEVMKGVRLTIWVASRPGYGPLRSATTLTAMASYSCRIGTF